MADQKEAELQNAARRIVDLLRSALAKDDEPSSQNYEEPVQGEHVAVGNRQPATSGQPLSALGSREQAGTSQRPASHMRQQRTPGCPTAGNAVDHNMARAFPGLFKSGKKYSPPAKRRAVRSTSIQFFLLNKCAQHTPKSSDEMVLLRAGLGRRTISIPDNADHSEISMILLDRFSKMVPLEGAWMLYKAAGGSGQRKLSVLAPEAEGYTGAYLAKAFGGRSCLYIMPIQDTLDTSPLPYSSKEFDKMPKARCATCRLNMPVQLLALHATECQPESCSSVDPNLDRDESESPAFNDGNESPGVLLCTTPPHIMDVKVACPVCAVLFPDYFVEVHASTCGDRAIILHSSVRILPMLQQICSGMKLYGLSEMISQQPLDFRQLFVPGLLEKLDADFLVGAMFPIFSEPGSLRRQRESKIVNFLQDFIQSIEDEEERTTVCALEVGCGLETDGDEKRMVTVSRLLQWLTGQAHVPITSTEREQFRIQVEFDHACEVRYGTHTICFPVVNACSNSITLPTQHLSTYADFLSNITLAVNNSTEFGRS